MALVYPFRAYRYNPKIAPFERVLTQPYDKISPAMQDKYYAADPHNLIAIEKGRISTDDFLQNNVYTRAESTLNGWIKNQAVVQDGAPSFYAYAQEFTVPGSVQTRTRRGFIGAGKTRGIFLWSDLPTRTHPFGAKGGPAGTAAAHEDAHRTTVHVVQRPATVYRCDSRSCREIGQSRDTSDR